MCDFIRVNSLKIVLFINIMIKKNIFSLLVLFLIAHLIVWTLIPTLTNKNLPLDTIEALAWGSNLEWGYSKHPPFSAFAVEVFYQIFGNQDWAYYFLSQLFVISAFFAVYSFSKDFFQNEYFSLLSVFLLEGIYFYNFTTPEFNVNVSQLPFWALSIFFTWRCVKHDKAIDYLLLGVVISLGILSKYLFIYLVIGIKFYFIYLIIKGKKFDILNVFIPGFIAILILFPHIIWLIKNDYTTVLYGLQRTGGAGSFFDHLIFPIIFLGKQLGILSLSFLMVFFLLKKYKFKINYKDKKLMFLIFTILIPILLILLTSMIMGIKIRTMWMTPFYLFFGTFLIYIFNKQIKTKKIKKFLVSFLIIFFISPTIYSYISITHTNKRTDYEGKEIARLVQNRWDENFTNKISIVIGDEWFGGNLSYHLESRPKWLNNLKDINNIDIEGGVIYTGNPKILKSVCPGVYGTIKPIGICMIGSK